MHIEPATLSAVKVACADVATVSLLACYAKPLFTKPLLWIKTAVAAFFFSVFMQCFHLAVGPSEVHFIGAMTIYLCLGFLPTLFGFSVGLLLQGLIFEPTDLIHLGVNSLTLIIPLIAVDTFRKSKAQTSFGWQQLVTFDGIYYSGIVMMVGFWLSLSDAQISSTAWLAWASSYLPMLVIEPLLTLGTIRLLRTLPARSVVAPILTKTCVSKNAVDKQAATPGY